MPSTPSGEITLGSLSGSPLVYTDTGTYGTIVSRTLVISDYQGNVLETVNMGATLTYSYSITADNWYQFVCTVIDNTGTFVTTIYYVSTGFYWATYLAQFVATNCGCTGNNCNLEISQSLLQAALRFNLAGQSGAASAQACIIGANYFVNQNITSQLL